MKYYILIIILIIGCLSLGYLSSFLINDFKESEPERTYDGLRIGARTYFEAVNITKKYDQYGDWVCVNVNNMTFDRALEVCRHETFHEIWAECGESEDLEVCINKYNNEMKNE